MRTVYRAGIAVGLVAVGYFLGTMRVFQPADAHAQGAALVELSTPDKVKAAQKAIETAQQALVSDGKYQPVVAGFNSFAVTCGGVDAVKDLEEGRGVDPETFAGLYAGQAIGKFANDLKTDERGRLTYKDKVVRMYSINRIKKLYSQRAEFADRKIGGSTP